MINSWNVSSIETLFMLLEKAQHIETTESSENTTSEVEIFSSESDESDTTH